MCTLIILAKSRNDPPWTPRKEGEREPNGRLSRTKAINALHRDHAIIERERLNPLWGTPFGRLMREDKITRKEFDAGVQYRAMRQDMDRMLGLPCRSPQAMDLHKISGLSLARERDPEAETKFRKKFDAIEMLLGDRRPGTKWWMVDQLVIHDIPLIGYAQFLMLRHALGTIAGFLDARG